MPGKGLGRVRSADERDAGLQADNSAPDAAAAASAAIPETPRRAADEGLFELVCEWYGCAPRLAHMHALRHEQLHTIWTTLWFAKGDLTAPLDDRLRDKYAHVFGDAQLAAAISSPSAPLPAAPAGLSAEQDLLWTVGLVVLCDQVSRNIFRGQPRAYASDGLARRLAEARLRARFDDLPVAIRLSVVLVYVHSEDAADVAVVEGLLARLRPALEPVSPWMWASISSIAQNHRDRMRLFGRVPERNRIVGRASTEAELAYMAATGGV
jgi:uncharacterized protein (DUF924 family)